MTKSDDFNASTLLAEGIKKYSMVLRIEFSFPGTTEKAYSPLSKKTLDVLDKVTYEACGQLQGDDLIEMANFRAVLTKSIRSIEEHEAENGR